MLIRQGGHIMWSLIERETNSNFRNLLVLSCKKFMNLRDISDDLHVLGIFSAAFSLFIVIVSFSFI